jgi:DNA repair protein RecO (recombination protein O)
MKVYASPCIILRIKEIGESDLLVTFFSADEGRLTGIAKGARRSRRRFVNCLDHFCLSTLEYSTKPGRDLCFLQSGKLRENFPSLRSDYSLLALASYMVELTETLFPLRVADSAMFELLKTCLAALHEGKGGAALRLLFEARAMTLGGYRIHLSECSICGRPYKGEGRAVFNCRRGSIACLNCARETAETPGMGPESVSILDKLQSGWWPEFDSMHLAEGVVRELRPVLIKHIEYRIGKRLKTSTCLG